MTAPGVLLETTPAMSWAWVGVRVRPEQRMGWHGRYPDVDESQHLTRTVTHEHAWLTSLWTTDHQARWELRFRSEPKNLLSCTLLGRVQDRDPHRAVEAALWLRERLGKAPEHVQTVPLLDAEEVKGWLVPGALDGHSTFEVRKRLSWTNSTRTETNRAYCFAVHPLRPPEDRSWEPLWRKLSRTPHQTVLSVYLEPYRPSPALANELRLLADEYRYLAQARTTSTPWTVTRPGVGLAEHAAPLYARAADLYTSRPCFRTRISVASQGPGLSDLPELAAAVTGGGVACPLAPGDLDTGWRNLAALNRDWLELTYGQGAPVQAMRHSERILCDLSDVDEAATAFRLPYVVAGHLPLFDMRGR
ncbi:hypothetical protein JNUCC0626_05740 [Lentzea sp. JNUCC 0626]|uniref:hypothetical protein n=1 Tax=Lentzea sp. JNUCC 0626 TaxID=3367513 RepID=UPI00374844D9